MAGAFIDYHYLTALAALVVAGLIGWYLLRFVRYSRPTSDGPSDA